MRKVLHISTECYPAAKSGGLGDVVGALPIYQQGTDLKASVIIPKYDLPWFRKQKFTSEYKGQLKLGKESLPFEVLRMRGSSLGFTFYCIDIPGLFDRSSIYLAEDGNGFVDEPQRNIGFQRAVVQWLVEKKDGFDLLHCHDHQTGLIPFFLKCVPEFKTISKTPTLFTIHNAQYKGIFQWTDQYLLPDYNNELNGWIDWDNCIHSLATAVKLADKVTTVSPSYMEEITEKSGSLEYLFKSEAKKCSGILNGIDTTAWDPKTDQYLEFKRTNQWASFKNRNKKWLCSEYGLKIDAPLIGFIGRLAIEKGADQLADAIVQVCQQKAKVNFIILGSGDRQMENQLTALQNEFPDRVAALIMYNEGLAHKIYAGCDFLVMPSRFEPCGLNQMYAMRYGTIPIVRSTGGLKDTVPDITDGGNGLAYSEPTASELAKAVIRAVDLFANQDDFKKLRKKIVSLDFSWEQSTKLYHTLYEELTA